VAYGERVGTLSYSSAVPLRSAGQTVLDDLAGHIGGLLHAHRIGHDLRVARERLVLATEEERRRLRRDLHDGLGPALAGHLLRVDVAARAAEPGSAAEQSLIELQREMQSTMSDLRRVVEGLRPPALDELGLTGAVQQVVHRLTAGTAVRVELEVAPLPQLPAAVEVAAFRIVSEAVTNVVKHAGATRCRIAIDGSRRCLQIRVEDDGRGGQPRSGSGHGLETMRERAEELGGALLVTASEGTTVCADLPLERTAG
jgi:signal transduction histidine kinase